MVRNAALIAIAQIVVTTHAFAAGGTCIVATEGRMAYVSNSLPRGAESIINHPQRTKGWNSWFTELPNDVKQYAFDIRSTADINKLLSQLASVEADSLCVRLCHQPEPSGLGWVTKLPNDNGIAAIFSIGDQEVIDHWYKQMRKPFGVMEFIDVPVAVPPTLTIFVGNQVVSLDELNIPNKLRVTFGNVPTVFYKSNTTLEQLSEGPEAKQLRQELKKRWEDGLDSAELETVKQIETFIERR